MGKTNDQRINNIIGQLNGVKTMLKNKKDCSAVIVQLSAIKSAVNSLSAAILEENFSSCLGKNKKSVELKNILKKLIENN